MRCGRCQADNPEAARFCNQCGAPLAAASSPELKRLTILFCDLVGSVRLASQLDPEDWHALLAAYQAAASAAVRRHHGHVAQHLGDGLVAYFGYPLAAEDDAVRAVEAALDIVREASALRVPESDATLQVRVGLHTGATVMGQVGGHEGEVLAVGDTPNVAARVQAVAAPNTVVLGPATRALVDARVRCLDLGDHTLKGLDAPLRLYQVVGLRERGEADGSGRGWVPFLGRERELARLQQRWEEAADAGRAVLLRGEPGIGKSRLARELRARVVREEARTWTMRCSAHTINTPFAPVAQFVRGAMAALGGGEDGAAALGNVLARAGLQDAGVAAPLRALLGIDPPDAGGAVSAQALRERTFGAVGTVLRTLSSRRRTLLLVEDLQWADPSTLEWLGRMLQQGLPPGLMLLLLARTEFSADWAELPALERLTLDPCGAQDAAALVAALDRERALPAPAVERIVERAEGNPLFVEEFTRSALEAQGEDIPLTLQDQTLARLDRLGAAKQVLQQAAVIGRRFSRSQLRAASGLPEDLVEEGLQRGVAAHMLRSVTGTDEGVYAFRHALLRDAAYASLLRSIRQATHARVAEAILADDPACVREQPELLAHHYTEAGQAQQAIAHWLAAARLALARSACLETAAHARTALRLLGEPGGNPQALALELELRLALAPALMAVRGVLDPEVGESYARARQLCEQLGNGPKLLVPLWGLWAYELVRGEVDRAQAVARQIRKLADAGTQAIAPSVAAATNGLTLFYRGELAAARDECARGLGASRLPPSAVRSARGVHDPGVMCHAFHAIARWLLGETGEAQEEAAALRASIPGLPPFDAAYAWCADAVLHTLADDPAATLASAARAIAIGKEQAFPAWQTMGAMMHGWARARQGDAQAALKPMRRSFDGWCASGARNLRPFFLLLLADAWLSAGDAEQALQCAERGLAEAASGERCWDAELHRLRAESLARVGRQEAALVAAREALATAERMGAAAWSARARDSLQRMLKTEASA